MTETAPVICVTSPADNVHGSVGAPVASAEVRIHPLPEYARDEGELWVRGGIVFRGYYRNPEETARAFHGSWFRTGDIARRDRHGHVFICGRAKNVIVTAGGKNVYPEDVLRGTRGQPSRTVCLIQRGRILPACQVNDLHAAGIAELEFRPHRLGPKTPGGEDFEVVGERDVGHAGKIGEHRPSVNRSAPRRPRDATNKARGESQCQRAN